MITLYGFGPGFGLPEISPFVTKTEVQLKMAGLEYRKARAMPPASPKGQLPYIEDDAERIADSTFIRAHVEGKYGFDFDAGLDLYQRAQAWAFERMIEHHIYWALIGARWVDADNFAKGPSHFFDGAPENVREKLREDAQFRVAENYLLSGLGRHAPDDDVELAVRSLFALSVQLGDKPYLMGEKPCGSDATAFGAMAGILTPFFDSKLRQLAQQFQNLTDYVDRMMGQYYPDFAWTRLPQAAGKRDKRDREAVIARSKATKQSIDIESFLDYFASLAMTSCSSAPARVRLSGRPARPLARRYGRHAPSAPPPRQWRRIFAGYAAGSWCPTLIS